MNKYQTIVAVCCLMLFASGGEVYAAAGQFQFVAGTVKVVNRAGVERVAIKGMNVDEGDTVATAVNASAQIRMVDGGFVAVRSDSRLKLETFVFNGKEDGQERSLIMLLKGGFRAITGLIGNQNKQNYLIKTPTATIGVRGTDHEPMYIPPPSTGVATGGVPGTYDKVNIGAAFIKTDFGVIHINPNQVGFVAGADKIPLLLPKIPEFYKPAPSDKVAPNDLQGKGLKSGNMTGDKTTRAGMAPNNMLAPTTLIAPTTLQIAPTTTLIAPTTLSTTTLVAPTTSTLSTTTLVAPTTSTLSTTTLVAPTTTTLSTTTLVAPTTTLVAPTTTLIAPTTTTLVAPTTTTLSTTTLVAPTTTLVAPTTLTAPTTLIIK